MNYFLSFILIFQVLNIIFLVRHQTVFEFRRRLLKEIDTISRYDVAIKLLNEMMAVKYSDMVLQWWKPLKSFYSKEILKLLD